LDGDFALQSGIDCTVLGGDHIPAWFGHPRRRRHLGSEGGGSELASRA
jgi:hypothetical protein